MIRAYRMIGRVLLGMLLPGLALAQVQATLDRSQAQLGDTVTLNLQSQSGPVAAPDLSPLSGDFEVLGRSSGSTASYVNGRPSVQYSYGVALRPLHEGTLRIPPLHVGNDTTGPLTLTVTAPTPASAAANGPVFVEAAVEPHQAYVGQQLSLSVKLYYTANLANASLSDPRADGVDASRIGGDTDYQAERNGRIYNVIERRYALVPQRPGTLTIPPIAFQGDLLDPNDPNSFLGMGAPVSARTQPVVLDVKPAPPGWGAAAWLPARRLGLTLDGLPDAAHPARVGQPFNLTLTLEATGLSYESLPALSLPTLDGATAYPDKPVTGNRTDGPWVVGRRQQAFAVVPGKAGKLLIPAITVRWWDVQADQAETATIPAHEIAVLPAAGQATAPAPAGSSAVPAAEPAVAATAATPASPAGAGPGPHVPWKALALAGLLLWLVTLAVLLLRWRRRPPAASARETASPRATAAPAAALRRAFVEAAHTAGAAEQARALLAWARAERPALRNLDALADALDPEAQRAAIHALQRAVYAEGAAPPERAAVESAFAGGFVWRTDGDGAGSDVLPPLYPFTLR